LASSQSTPIEAVATDGVRIGSDRIIINRNGIDRMVIQTHPAGENRPERHNEIAGDVSEEKTYCYN